MRIAGPALRPLFSDTVQSEQHNHDARCYDPCVAYSSATQAQEVSPLLLVAESFRMVSASARILELRHSSSSFGFHGYPLGSTGSPAALRRESA